MKLEDLDIKDIGNTIQMVGVIYAGGGIVYQCIFPGEEVATAHVATFETLDMSLEDWLTFLKQTDVMETEILTRAKDGSITKAIYRKSQRQLDQNVSWAVWKRDNYTCRYCGNDNIPLTVDHLVRWEEGGPTTPENLLSACKKCNRTRGDMPYVAWLRHSYYLKQSEKLPSHIKKANEDVASTLDKIQRVIHVRSR